MSATKYSRLFLFFYTENHYTAQRDYNSDTDCGARYIRFYFNILIIHEVTIPNTVQTVNLFTQVHKLYIDIRRDLVLKIFALYIDFLFIVLRSG